MASKGSVNDPGGSRSSSGASAAARRPWPAPGSAWGSPWQVSLMRPRPAIAASSSAGSWRRHPRVLLLRPMGRSQRLMVVAAGVLVGWATPTGLWARRGGRCPPYKNPATLHLALAVRLTSPADFHGGLTAVRSASPFGGAARCIGHAASSGDYDRVAR